MDRIERFLLQLTLFLIPSNLAYHWYIEGAFVQGKLIDYLLPKVYLSDLPIILLILIFVFKHKAFKLFVGIYQRNKTGIILTVIFLFYLVIIGLTSIRPSASLWYWLKIFELLLFGFYLVVRYTPQDLLRLGKTPIIAALITQVGLGLYQFITQQSLFGYIFLGEPKLQPISTIAKTDLLGRIRLMPYGTTPHPNVLAGVIAVYLLWLLGYNIYNPNHSKFNVLKLILLGLSILIILLTQSISILISFVIVMLFIKSSANPINRRRTLIITLVIVSTFLIGLIFATSQYQPGSPIDNQSIIRRYKLILASFQLLRHRPLTGVGLNNFIPAALYRADPTDIYAFPQPVHNIYLLYLVETGFLGGITLIWLLFAFKIPLYRLLKRPYLVAPSLLLAIVGLIDHYPLTLQPGLLLLTFSLSLFPRSPHQLPLLT